MERTRVEKAKELMQKFDGKKIVRADGRISDAARIWGVTTTGSLVLQFDSNNSLCWCPPSFTDDNWKEA